MALSPAKLNLYLDVGSRRDDGYHEIETLFVALDWGDQVLVSVRPSEDGVHLQLSGDVSVPDDEQNLAWRAAAIWRQAAGEATGDAPDVAVDLSKSIPVGSGLGGGSSNAATVLRRANAKLGKPLPDAELYAMARDIGSDVAFFLTGGAAIGRGRGDRIEPLTGGTPLPVVLILPPIMCSTPTVYAQVKAPLRPAPENGLDAAIHALRAGDPKALRDAHFNALAIPALTAYPPLLRFTSDVERRLGRAPCLSGSGSALFDIPDADDVQNVLDKLDGLPGERIVANLVP